MPRRHHFSLLTDIERHLFWALILIQAAIHVILYIVNGSLWFLFTMFLPVLYFFVDCCGFDTMKRFHKLSMHLGAFLVMTGIAIIVLREYLAGFLLSTMGPVFVFVIRVYLKRAFFCEDIRPANGHVRILVD